jgi:hypothetical protein
MTAGPLVQTTETTSTTNVGFGITFVIDGKPITLEADDLTAIAKGNFAFAMTPGQTIGFDKLSDFYTSLTGTFTFLPVLDWTSLPEPLKTMATFGLTISDFSISIVSGSLQQVGVTLTVLFHDWAVPGIPKLQIQSTTLSVSYSAASQVTSLTAGAIGDGQPVTASIAS